MRASAVLPPPPAAALAAVAERRFLGKRLEALPHRLRPRPPVERKWLGDSFAGCCACRESEAGAGQPAFPTAVSAS